MKDIHKIYVDLFLRQVWRGHIHVVQIVDQVGICRIDFLLYLVCACCKLNQAVGLVSQRSGKSEVNGRPILV